MARTILGLALAVAIAGSALAHNGNTGVIPAWPDPTTFVLDGEEDDWGWLDTEAFAHLPESMQSVLGEHQDAGPNPNPEDFTAAVFIAWSPPPDNSFYLHMRAQDDTLRALESLQDDWWNDDNLQLDFDFDHSGGEFGYNETTHFDNGYRLQFHPIGTKEEGGQAPPFTPEDGPVSWGGVPPWTYSTTTILPAGATHGATNVEYTYEVRTHPWAVYANSGPDESVSTIFEPEMVIHFNWLPSDGDRDVNGQQDLWSPQGATIWECAVNGDNCPDMILVPTDMVDPYTEWTPETGTAVENRTWGRIKEFIAN